MTRRSETKILTQSPSRDSEDRARLLAGRDPRQTHFDFYLQMTACLDLHSKGLQRLREHDELGPGRAA
jgi:hypothetical protein